MAGRLGVGVRPLNFTELAKEMLTDTRATERGFSKARSTGPVHGQAIYLVLVRLHMPLVTTSVARLIHRGAFPPRDA